MAQCRAYVGVMLYGVGGAAALAASCGGSTRVHVGLVVVVLGWCMRLDGMHERPDVAGQWTRGAVHWAECWHGGAAGWDPHVAIPSTPAVSASSLLG